MIACAVFSAGALAKAPADDAEETRHDRHELTPVGAERGGNKDGTIPAWTGGITAPPSGYKVGMHHPDPFAGDKAQFEITAKNYKDYGDKLSAGQIAMFEKYPDWKMVVYPTHRSASFPQRIYDYSIKNASTGELVDDGEGVDQVAEGFPVPDPRQRSGKGRHGSDLEPQAEVQGRVVRTLEQSGDPDRNPDSTH